MCKTYKNATRQWFDFWRLCCYSRWNVLKKRVQYHSGYYVGADAERNLYKVVVVFLIVSLKNSVPCVVKALPETSISGYWLSEEIDKCITNLKEIGLQVRAVVSDDHASNVSAFSILLNKDRGDNELFIYHPAYGDQLKTFIFWYSPFN